MVRDQLNWFKQFKKRTSLSWVGNIVVSHSEELEDGNVASLLKQLKMYGYVSSL